MEPMRCATCAPCLPVERGSGMHTGIPIRTEQTVYPQKCYLLPAPGDPEPTWHRVAEVPVLAAVITAYQGQARTYPCCGHLTRAVIPPEIRAHVVGPDLAAVMPYFSGRHRLGKR